MWPRPAVGRGVYEHQLARGLRRLAFSGLRRIRRPELAAPISRLGDFRRREREVMASTLKTNESPDSCSKTPRTKVRTPKESTPSHGTGTRAQDSGCPFVLDG